MTLALKLKKCGCLYEMKFDIHHLQNFRYKRMTLYLKSEKCGCLPLWDEILYSSFAKFPYTRMAISLKLEKCGCIIEMKFYIHHLQNFGIQEWPWPWIQKSVVASMRWNSIFIICKILVYKNGPVPEIGKVWLPLWDEILYASFAKFWYTRMTLTLKSKKCGCLWDDFFIHHLHNWGIRTLYKNDPGPVMRKMWLPLWDEFFIHHLQIFGT